MLDILYALAGSYAIYLGIAFILLTISAHTYFYQDQLLASKVNYYARFCGVAAIIPYVFDALLIYTMDSANPNYFYANEVVRMICIAFKELLLSISLAGLPIVFVIFMVHYFRPE